MNENEPKFEIKMPLYSSPPLADEEGLIPIYPPLATDPLTGQLLPMSDEERAGRRASSIRASKLLKTMIGEDDTDERWLEIYRSIDSHRPHRPLFEKWTKGGADSDA